VTFQLTWKSGGLRAAFVQPYLGKLKRRHGSPESGIAPCALLAFQELPKLDLWMQASARVPATVNYLTKLVNVSQALLLDLLSGFPTKKSLIGDSGALNTVLGFAFRPPLLYPI
jgi:hypothetical protein